MSNIIDSIQLSGVTYTLSAQTSGEGKSVEAGRGISVSSGTSAYTVSFNLPISAGTGSNSIAEGNNTAAIGDISHAEGDGTIANGISSHAEGASTTASGICSHAEGYYTQARGNNSHAEGNNAQARGNDSHAEGYGTMAAGNYSHAEGYQTFVSSNYSHAEGYNTTVDGNYSHAEGNYTIAINQSEHASGQYNVSNNANNTFGNSGNTLFSVGNGTSYNARHNAFEIRQNGDIYLSSGGTDIKLQDHLGGGGGNPTVELTQAEYDALVSAGTVSADTYYIITDATAVDLTNYYTKSETNTLLNGKQATLVSGTNIKTINNESILGSGNIDIQGGSTYTAGRGISIANDTISFSLPISAGTGTNSVIIGGTSINNGNNNLVVGSDNNISSGSRSLVVGYRCSRSGDGGATIGWNSTTSGDFSIALGEYCTASAKSSFARGSNNNASKQYSFASGYYINANNYSEHSCGQYNVSSSASTAFGNSGNTLFSVGNGTADNARHNAFEIRQNGDIYLSLNGQDVKLQDQLGGSGSSINVVQTTGSSTTDVMSQDAVTTQLSGYVTTNTEQTISGRKIFTYSSANGKAIEFKQTSDSAKVGFGIKNSASTNNEVASFEFRPNTFTIDNVQHPLLYFGHYRNTNIANAGVPQTVIGFRQYDQKNAAAYHYLMPLPEKAKTPFNLTTSFKDYYAPMGFKNGSTMITADNTGVVDLSSELGGLKLVKLTQAEYDALAAKDSNTLYVIVN